MSYEDSYDVQFYEADEWRDKMLAFSTIGLAKDWAKKNMPATLRVRILCLSGAIYERTYDHQDNVKWVRRV